MQIFLISDNIDSSIGFRLAGIEGIIIHEKNQLVTELNKICNNPNIAIILITEKILQLDFEFIYNLKLKIKKPLIVEIPDRHLKGNISHSITKYIQEAIGIKI